jgi:hypothetical protein
MNYKICIPSYGRPEILKQETLNTLAKQNIDVKLIYIFVVEEEYENYKSILPNYNIIVGVKGLVNQREFIHQYFEEGQRLVMLDDDITQIDTSLTPFAKLNDFIKSAFFDCEDEKAYIWSVYPVFNPFYRLSQKYITTDLRFCVGTFYGLINRKNQSDLSIKQFVDDDEKEDTFRTLLHFIKDGKVLRYNRVGFKTIYYRKDGSGMGIKKDRLIASKYNTLLLEAKFTDYGKVSVRKTGIYEFNLKKIKSFDNDRSITQIPFTNFTLLGELYDKLEKINITCRNTTDTRRGFGKHRSCVFGITKQRATHKIAIAKYSVKHPEIWKLIQQIGDHFDIDYNAVHLNKDVICPKHKDEKNVGKSVLLSFGDYTGCNIVIEGNKYDANCNGIIFNGANLEHWNTDDLQGTKYSLIFYKAPYELPD